jgi:hypothetical protein
MRLQSALEARVAAGAPGALARIEAPRLGLAWDGAAGQVTRGESRSRRRDDAVRVASVAKSVTAVAAVKLARDGRLVLDGQLGDQLALELLHRWSAFPGYDAVLVGTHSHSQVDRWPLVAALCQQLRDTVPAEHRDGSNRP